MGLLKSNQKFFWGEWEFNPNPEPFMVIFGRHYIASIVSSVLLTELIQKFSQNWNVARNESVGEGNYQGPSQGIPLGLHVHPSLS